MMRSCVNFSMLLMLLSISFSASVTGTPVVITRYKKNLNGSVLVLHAGSLRYRGNHPPFPFIMNPKGCENVCMAVPGCTGWNYCNRTEGCGSGCKAYAATSTPLKPEPGNFYALPKGLKLSDLVKPGPYDNICHYTHTDRWNYGVCTLKKATNPPTFWSSKDEGWRSGTVQAPKACGSTIPASTCNKCSAGPADRLSQCLRCARTMSAPSRNPVPDTLIYSGQVKPDGCAACTKAEVSSPSTCINQCLVPSGKKCAQCALQGTYLGNGGDAPTPAPFDVQSCVDCTRKYGGSRYQACANCAGFARPKERSVCLTCLQRFTNRMCPDSSNSPQPTDCVPQDACHSCASISNSGTCFDCLARTPYNADCTACASLPAAGTEAVDRCYKCAKNTTDPPPYGACSYCLSIAPKDAQQVCLDCVQDATIPVEGRGWCAGCTNWRPDLAGWNKCVACLKDSPQGTDYPRVCSG